MSKKKKKGSPALVAGSVCRARMRKASETNMGALQVCKRACGAESRQHRART